MRAWSRAYRDDGLVVIGVHTPGFSFEHELDRVRGKVHARAIDYPVALDNDYAIWNAFDNNYWPALYLVDRDGAIRDHHLGEGRYEQSERAIQQLLGIERELVSVQGLGAEADADWDNLRSPETYLGFARGEPPGFTGQLRPLRDWTSSGDLRERDRRRADSWSSQYQSPIDPPPRRAYLLVDDPTAKEIVHRAPALGWHKQHLAA